MTIFSLIYPYLEQSLQKVFSAKSLPLPVFFKDILFVKSILKANQFTVQKVKVFQELFYKNRDSSQPRVVET